MEIESLLWIVVDGRNLGDLFVCIVSLCYLMFFAHCIKSVVPIAFLIFWYKMYFAGVCILWSQAKMRLYLYGVPLVTRERIKLNDSSRLSSMIAGSTEMVMLSVDFIVSLLAGAKRCLVLVCTSHRVGASLTIKLHAQLLHVAWWREQSMQVIPRGDHCAYLNKSILLKVNCYFACGILLKKKIYFGSLAIKGCFW